MRWCDTPQHLAIRSRRLRRHALAQDYVEGDEYEYHGDFFDVSPVVLEVPYDDHWYLVVDSNERRIKVEFAQIFD